MFPKPNARINVTKPQLVTREPAQVNKKKELDDIASATLSRVIDSVDDKLVLDKLDSFQKRQFSEQIYDTLVMVLEEGNIHLSQSDKQKIIQFVSDEIFGYGPINSLLDDPSVTEIMVNGWDNIFVERNGKITKTEITFRDNEHVLHVINKIITPLGRRIDESSPTVDARMPDGSRVNAIIPPLSLKGPSITIRKFSADPFTMNDLIDRGTMTHDMIKFVKACVRAKVNIIVSGGTGSGKTTTLNVLSSFIPTHERIVTIEDTAELQLNQDNIVTLESRPANIEGRGQFTIRELVINSLRMRPDRIVIGEVRGAEALDMLQAMNTGHDGSISTLHANTPRDALGRLETMVLMAGMELPLRVIREQLGSAIELIIQQSRFSDGSRKITKISEVVGIVKDEIQLQDIFVYKQSDIDEDGIIIGEHLPTGIMPLCIEKLKAHGEHIEIEEMLAKASELELPEAELKRPEDDQCSEYDLLEVSEINTSHTEDSSFQSEDQDYFVPIEEDEEELEDEDEETEEENEDSEALGKHNLVLVSSGARTYEAGQAVPLTTNPVNEIINNVFVTPLMSGITKNETAAETIVNSESPADLEPVEADEEVPKAESQHLDAFMAEKEQKSKEQPAATQRQNSLSRKIPPNMRGMSIPVSDLTGICSFISQGDKVDVIVTYDDQNKNGLASAYTAAQDAVVLAVNGTPDRGEKMQSTTAVILAVSSENAETMVCAYKNGTFHLILCPDS